MIFRELKISDYEQFLILINDFQKTNFRLDQFKEIIENQNNTQIYVMEKNNQLIAAGTICFEKKFIHNISLYCHIEDIIVKKIYQKNGYGKLLINNLIQICKDEKCYKILLNCEEKLIKFYEKCGFVKKGVELIIYL
jgi:glucosamine-phosphate N-acetyltransferase